MTIFLAKEKSEWSAVHSDVVRVFLQDLPTNAVAAGDFGCAKGVYREKLVAIVSRCECVYKRVGELSGTFHERGGAAE